MRSGANEMKIYISGKITGLKNYRRLFKKAEKRLTKKGFTVLNPVTIGDNLYMPGNISEEAKWKKYMKADLRAMLGCDGVYLLNNWEDSKGAKMECDIAVKCGMSIFKEGEL